MNSIDSNLENTLETRESITIESRPLSYRLKDAARSIGTAAMQRAYHQVKEYSLPFGRVEYSSTAELTQEAMRRGANQKPEELRWMLDAVAEKQPANVIEIGSRFGGVFFALAHLATETARLTSIDLPGGRFGGGYGRVGKRRLGSYALPTQKFRSFQKDSHDPNTLEEVQEWLDGQPVDFLFIDGDHSREGAQKDWEMYSPLVSVGGIIGFHDIAHHAFVPECQVDEVWRNVIKPGHNVSEYIGSPNTWGGIGLVKVEK